MVANECTSVAGHFDGHSGAALQYGGHCLMQHDQGFAGSHLMPQLGNYSLRIAPAAARATINPTIMQHVPTLLAISMAIAMRRYYTACIAQWRRFVAFIKATKHHHWASTCSDSINRTPKAGCFRHFIVKRAPVDMLAPN
jgi:hypothetical protein